MEDKMPDDHYSILPESCIIGQLQSHQNHDPERFGGIQQLIDHLRAINQYDVLHISAEIRFSITTLRERA